MYILNKKMKKECLTYNTKILEVKDANFIILDDNTYENKKDIYEISEEIKKFKYNVEIVNIQELMKSISNIIDKEEYLKDINLIVCIGTGGKQAFEALKKWNSKIQNIECCNIKWSRDWQEEISNRFETDIENFDFKNKNILILEDVIATGETLYNVCENIKSKGGNVKGIISAIINEGSPLLEKSFINTLVSLKINGEEGKNPFWYPPIYSTRHLFWGDLEMPKFFEILNKKYFSEDKKIEESIKIKRGKQ